ncbi:hypothetical protein [Spongiactinospora sp. 9N601]|uniref:hypothetical protein n=1 Tax=Spongiactinospora sp. 9N601 TaxID=3375149 RepID=UPI0037B638BA
MTDLLVGGEWAAASGGARFQTVNPADGTVITECAEAAPADTGWTPTCAAPAPRAPNW